MYKKYKILIVFLFASMMHAEDFITNFEYGQMLYHEPRGVSCVPCHGETGEGRDIASYKNKRGETVVLRGPDIRDTTLSKLTQSLKNGKGVMPRYFFTNKEIKMIYSYLKKVNATEENNSTKGEEQ